ncbi:hypothetical protein RU92_GL001138 [Lactococcus cremoris subsp. tructae]|uniref:MFS transporter n=1 Tax=Lactococcus cremoris subsp. tructae TaxID=542833 RepID=A0A2A5SPR7_LACLC|nr:hypothetical protein RU92_GL001138 [Lactococcus cremoris subsp. tructae]
MSFGIGLIILLKSRSALIFGISQFLGPVVCFIFTKQMKNILEKYKVSSILKLSLFSTTIISLLIGFSLWIISNQNFLFLMVILLLTLNAIFNQMFSVSYNISCKFLVSSEAEVKRLKSLEEVVGAIALIISPLLAATLFTILNSTVYIILSAAIDFITLFMVSRLVFFNKEYEPDTEINDSGSLLNTTKNNDFIVRRQTSLFIIVPTIISIGFSSINVGLPFIQIDKLSLSAFQYAFTKVLWAVGMLISGVFLIKNLKKESKLADFAKSILIMGAIVMLFSVSLLMKFFPPFLSISLFNLFFAIIIVRYRVILSVNTLNNFSESALNNILTKQKNYDQLFRAVSVMLFGYLYDRVPFTDVFLLTAVLMIIAGLFYMKILDLRHDSYKVY